MDVIKWTSIYNFSFYLIIILNLVMYYFVHKFSVLKKEHFIYKIIMGICVAAMFIEMMLSMYWTDEFYDMVSLTTFIIAALLCTICFIYTLIKWIKLRKS